MDIIIKAGVWMRLKNAYMTKNSKKFTKQMHLKEFR